MRILNVCCLALYLSVGSLILSGCVTAKIEAQSDEWEVRQNQKFELEVTSPLVVQVVFRDDRGEADNKGLLGRLDQYGLDSKGKGIERDVASQLSKIFPDLTFSKYESARDGPYFLILEIEEHILPSLVSTGREWAAGLTVCTAIECTNDYLYTVRSSIVSKDGETCRRRQIEKVTYSTRGPDFYDVGFKRRSQRVYGFLGAEALGSFIRKKNSPDDRSIYTLVCD